MRSYPIQVTTEAEVEAAKADLAVRGFDQVHVWEAKPSLWVINGEWTGALRTGGPVLHHRLIASRVPQSWLDWAAGKRKEIGDEIEEDIEFEVR